MSLMNVSRDGFSHEQGHHVNWYVYRDKNVRKDLSSLWNNGLGIKNKQTMEGASIDQRICKAVNVLFRNMEMEGPFRTEFNNYRYDSINDYYHVHVWDACFSYIVMWEIDKKEKVINIVRIGTHENFDYKRNKKHKKAKIMEEIKQNRVEDNKYQEHLRFEQERKRASKQRNKN